MVTGAGSTPGPGMATGRACAIVLAREGARVLLADVDGARAEETREIIEGEGGQAVVFAGDMTKAADCAAMVAAAVDAFGTLDILVNNIGVSIAGNVVDTDEADWDRVLDLSLKTMFLASKNAVPVMAAKGAGAIVNIGSIAGSRGGNYVGYAAAKGGVNALTVDMAFSHGRQGIRVNAVAPGHITTPLLFSVLGVTPEADYRQRLAAAANLLGTAGDGWDVGWAATFLASDEARWITGAVLPVDGGVMAVTPLMMAAGLRAEQPPA
ncbi:SDR family oxidoreductase [Frankia sp. AgB1.9]|uniref:SDR family NAD(P)-dependent oxidoreductase n=1 Tax=unclassified Frankia TaxID=2632575 RepID=UPI001934663F|nr:MULTISPECIES: SDR family oxidoreductase [unclassified Frankia]MBL7488319.1 SDR family oxidoreductase [Frankia sp. AgW1.1]MBL7548526.1 SDR family oxidoreductase [Frankia sp. AgB1.9]MBL7619577.1 SDR family oxidoreductase [Frankia sp. AgB1.8]